MIVYNLTSVFLHGLFSYHQNHDHILFFFYFIEIGENLKIWTPIIDLWTFLFSVLDPPPTLFLTFFLFPEQRRGLRKEIRNFGHVQIVGDGIPQPYFLQKKVWT